MSRLLQPATRLCLPRSSVWAMVALMLFIGGVLAGVGCGSKSGGGMTHPATLVYTKNGKTLTTVTGP